MSSQSLRSRARECCDQFQLLLSIGEEIGSVNEAEDNIHDVMRVEDQFARFKMWGANIGVFAEGHASLDYRLRDSDETKHFMLDFLVSLSEFIHRGM
jgi:hypothetical protein